MGFTSGFIGGVTLTTGILYLTLSAHKQNRARQSLALRQQTLLIDDVRSPRPSMPESILRVPQAERHARAGALEAAKDRWNREVEALVRRVNEVDWAAAREEAEGLGRAALRSLTSSAAASSASSVGSDKS